MREVAKSYLLFIHKEMYSHKFTLSYLIYRVIYVWKDTLVVYPLSNWIFGKAKMIFVKRSLFYDKLKIDIIKIDAMQSFPVT